MHRLFLLSSIILLAACNPFITSTPPAAPQPLQVAYTAATRPFEEILHQCALENPEISLIVQETSVIELGSVGADIRLWFGEPAQAGLNHAYQLGVDQIVMIAGTQVTMQNISAEQIRDLYTDPQSAYQVWTYGEGNELREIFDVEILAGGTTSSNAKLVPHPAAMIEALSANPQAIGYLPASWQTEGLPKISLQEDLQNALVRPILAETATQPQGGVHDYLLCLQQTAP